MTEEQRDELHLLCIDYRGAGVIEAHKYYLKLRDYVETLVDEAAKDAIGAKNSDKTE